MKTTFPELGDCRNKKGFLFLPMTINNERRWLEYAKWTEVYSVVPIYIDPFVPKAMNFKLWTPYKWLD